MKAYFCRLDNKGAENWVEIKIYGNSTNMEIWIPPNDFNKGKKFLLNDGNEHKTEDWERFNIRITEITFDSFNHGMFVSGFFYKKIKDSKVITGWDERIVFYTKPFYSPVDNE